MPVSITGVQVSGHLDTGANVTAVLPRSLYERIAATSLFEAGTGQLSNGKINVQKATINEEIVIGDVRLQNLDVRVSNDFPELLIGSRVLSRYLLAIDQRSRQVALCEVHQ